MYTKDWALVASFFMVLTLTSSPSRCEDVSRVHADDLLTPPDEVIQEVGRRIVSLTIPVKGDAGVVQGMVSGSGYLVNGKLALTAAHVVRELSVGDAMVVQVGALARGANYLTTGHLVRVDEARDIAVISIDLYQSEMTADFRSSLARVCDHNQRSGRVFLGGTSRASNGGSGIERSWGPVYRSQVLGLKYVPEMEKDTLGYWKQGESVILLDHNANEGDSGGAVFGVDGCLMGVISMNAPVNEPVDGFVEKPMFAVPVSEEDVLVLTRE